ncbi:hypothetical protein [Halorussus halophilus]|uniref:hypothetical protein n=1 Tax=Halorussus halophilus TaxID=2650975 RepID=UPI0013012B5D|nr:hypothetical protein [Halorussus halophilus]
MTQTARRAFLAGVAGVLGSSTIAAAQSRDHILFAGGGPNLTIQYQFVVDGTVEKTSDNGGAAIADRHVTIDRDDRIREGKYVRGNVAGGGDGYRYSGRLLDFGVSVTADTAHKAKLYHNGERVDVREFGRSPPAGTPVEFVDSRTVHIEGDWGSTRGFTTTMYRDGIGTDHSGWGAVDGPVTLQPTWNEGIPYSLNSVALYETEDSVEPAYSPANPYAGAWNLETGGADLPNHVVVFGGGGGNVIEYSFEVSGDIEKNGSGGDAPIADQYVTHDFDDRIDGSSVSGTVAGGGDAYRFSGELSNLQANGARVYVNGERRA